METNKLPQMQSLTFPEAFDRSDLLSEDQRSNYYSEILRRNLLQGNMAVLDPDTALEMDPQAYQKIKQELGIAAKLSKRAAKTASAPWSFYAADRSLLPLCEIMTELLKGVKRLRTSLKAMTKAATLEGWATARIFGEFRYTTMPGDFTPRYWWLPTDIVNVSKQRWRVNRTTKGSYDLPEGADVHWTIQDVMNQQWYKLDEPGSPPGLRRADYVWIRSDEDEDDLGYSHGLSEALAHKWYMLTHAWIYGMDAAESWSKGKIIIQTPNSFGGATIPGSSGISEQRKQEVIRDRLATKAAEQLSRHVLVLDSDQEYTVVGRPDSGADSVSWLVKEIKTELDELILGVRPGEIHPWDVDPELVNEDKSILEEGVNADLVAAMIMWNLPNFSALGWCYEEVSQCQWQMKRESGFSPEQIGKNIQIAMAAGVPVHRKDIYRGLGLTPIDPGDEDAVFAPQPGSPVNGDSMGVRLTGPNDVQTPTTSTPAPSFPQNNPGGNLNTPV